MNPGSIRIDLQNDSGIVDVPDIESFENWVQASLQQEFTELEQCIRIVNEAESQQLNSNYRGIDTPTNVLSFPAENLEYLDYQYLGDLVICAPVIRREAREQHKSERSHWAHMVAHGMLHLQGFDHIIDGDAEKMEALEIEILAMLGHTNPYQNDERH